MWMRVRLTCVGDAVDGDVDAAAECERTFVLRNLVALRQVGIEVVLAREDRLGLDVAAERERRLDGEVHRLPVQHRQGAGQSEADRTDLRVRRRAEGGAAAAENLGAGLQLGVNFETDYCVKAHDDATCRCSGRDRALRVRVPLLILAFFAPGSLPHQASGIARL